MVSEENKRIARNTVLLYVRIFFAQTIALYTSRKIMEILGLEDFGIQVVVGGVLGMLCMLNCSMASATSRYLTLELGRKDMKSYNRIFSISVMIHILLALIVVITAETIGLWFINNHLNIPANRMLAANVVYQLSIVGIALGIIQSPYIASITAHEHMSIYAYIGIGQSMIYLLIVFGLSFVHNADMLIMYSSMMLVIDLIQLVIYRIYALHNFPHCHFHKIWDKHLFHEILTFTGWNTFGVVASTIKGSCINIFLNIFGGPIANAAAGIAYKVSCAINGLVSGFSSAMNPQIIKSYGAQDLDRVHRLLNTGSKMQCLLLAVAIVPISFEIEYLMSLWLVEVPPHAVWFVRLVLLENICSAFTFPMITSLLATGRIKTYQICLSSIIILYTPLTYIFLQLGASLEIIYISSIINVIAAHGGRIYFARKMIGLSLRYYVASSILPTIVVLILSYATTFIFHQIMHIGLLRLIVVIISGSGSVIVFSYFWGINSNERKIINHIIYSRLSNSPFRYLLIWKKQKQLG